MTDFGPEIIRNWLMIANMVGSAGLTVFVLFDRRKNRQEARINDLESGLRAQIKEIADRTAEAEKTIQSLPTPGQIVRLHVRIDDIFSSLQSINVLVGNLSGKIDMIRHD